MAKRSSKKEISLFDTTPTPATTATEPTTATATPTPATPTTATPTTATEPTTEPTTATEDQACVDLRQKLKAQGQTCVDLYQKLKKLLSYTDETLVAESEETVCEITKTLLAYVKVCFTERVEMLSASMATDSDMTQEMAMRTILALVGDKTGYDKLEVQLYICAYAPLLIKVNEYMRNGFQCFLAIAKACYEMNVQYLPANIRTLFNGCIVYQQKDEAGIMRWVFWTPACRTRNAVATHSIAQGCFIRSEGLEYLFTPNMRHVDVETREKPNTRGEIVNRPVIDYQWENKSQRVLAFWKCVGIDEALWQDALARYDTQAREHIITYKTSCEEKFAKASAKGALKGLETTKKAPNAVKVRNAKLAKLFSDMDF